MSSLRLLAQSALLLTLMPGCHARFKKHVASLGEVRTQAYTVKGPNVNLGMMYDDNIVAAVVNTVQVAKSAKVARRIAGAVDIQGVNYALQQGVAELLGSGPPFAYTDAKDAGATLQLEVVDWGLEVPALGQPGYFDYNLRVRMYLPDGHRIYSTKSRCTTSSGAPPEIALVFGVVNNVRQIEDMSDEEIQRAFDTVAKWCGHQVVRKIRKHAG